VVSDREGLGKTARAGGRHVRRWQKRESGEHGEGDASFSGDPCLAETYDWARHAEAVSVVIDMNDDADAQGALDAVRTVRPDAAVLVLSDGISHPPGDGTLTRAGDLRDVIRLDLDEELQRLEAERRVHRLREFVAGQGVVPVLVHPDPDPDAISSALALRTILRCDAEALPIVTLRGITRPENRRMVELLRARVTEISREEARSFGRLITIDSQPRMLGDDVDIALAVIDHHPVESGYEADYFDVRPEYGATATMMTEYLRADSRVRLGTPLATALLYGIKTDTDGLMRGVSPADVEAYAFLQKHADMLLLRRFERPSYPADAAQAYGRAIAEMAQENDLGVAHAGELDADRLHVLADLADFCLGIEGITWAAAVAALDEQLVITIRHLGREPGAGALARAIAEELDGSGGGHATMGRVMLPLETAARWLGDGGEGELQRLLVRLREKIDALAERDGERRAERRPAPTAGT
jgi:nanoRNase/pAp phosphatase (c-di-AMP/oligoRNAs hydrolase)